MKIILSIILLILLCSCSSTKHNEYERFEKNDTFLPWWDQLNGN